MIRNLGVPSAPEATRRRIRRGMSYQRNFKEREENVPTSPS